ncbi:hypothetical protein [Candidatus Nitrosocosmicus arcticus]|nr:hypothetical protein [Candidatus Nitrosocosmicus arcticus]
MNKSITFSSVLTVCCLVSTAGIMNWSLDVTNSYATSFLPEKNSTISNSSASDFEDNPITTIIIPNKGSNLTENSDSNNGTNSNAKSDIETNSSSSPVAGSDKVTIPKETISTNDTQNQNFNNDVFTNNTFSDSQQRGEYLMDNNGMHYYNINNCSEKKGSSGIANMSECEDAEKELSED